MKILDRNQSKVSTGICWWYLIISPAVLLLSINKIYTFIPSQLSDYVLWYCWCMGLMCIFLYLFGQMDHRPDDKTILPHSVIAWMWAWFIALLVLIGTYFWINNDTIARIIGCLVTVYDIAFGIILYARKIKVE